MTWNRPRAVAVLAGLSLVAAGAAAGTPTPITLTVKLDAAGRGTFTLRGSLVDSGRASARRAVANGRLHATIQLAGANGAMVITSSKTCDRTTGTWRVVSGTLAYVSVTGRGTMSGGTCVRPYRPTTIVHRGTVEVPPPVLASVGAWGGWTAQGHALTFTVLPGGRQFANLLIGGYRNDCVRSDGFKSTEGTEIDRTFPGPFPIADDRTFSVKVGGSTVVGRFTQAGAAGTVANSYTYGPDSQKRMTTCSATIAWTATQPPPPPKRALAGSYCGFRVGGGGACIDVVPGGREARNVRAEVWLSCGTPVARFQVKVPVAYDQAIRLDTDLSFRQTFMVPFEGGTASASVSGVFDENGALTASVGLAQPTTVVRDGKQSFCQSNGGFTAKL